MSLLPIIASPNVLSRGISPLRQTAPIMSPQETRCSSCTMSFRTSIVLTGRPPPACH